MINHPSYKPTPEATERVVARAIEQSIAQNEIVTLDDAPGLQDALFAECEGDADAHQRREFWGVDCDGGKWRVHVRV